MTLELDLRLALDAFELCVELRSSGRVLGVLGRSGAGKSSLLEVVAGLRRGARGSVRFAGESWLDTERRLFVPPERRGIGYVPQDGLLFPHKTARENLLAGSARAAAAAPGSARSLDEVAGRLGLSPLLSRSVTQLSGGERQRVALGRALCSAPRLLLLDEPFGALDLALRRSLVPFVARVLAEFELPALLVSHDPVEVQALCDEVIVLDRGLVVARGEPRRALAHAGFWWESTGFENTFVCEVAGTSDSPRARLGEGLELAATAVSPSLEPGDRALLVVPASDVIVAAVRPEALSARSLLPARVGAIEPFAHGMLLRAELAGGVEIAAELSLEAVRELELAPGRDVFLVLKSSACRLYSSSASSST